MSRPEGSTSRFGVCSVRASNRRTVEQNRNHAAKNKKIDFFFLPDEASSTVSTYNIFVLCVNLRLYSLSKVRSF